MVLCLALYLYTLNSWYSQYIIILVLYQYDYIISIHSCHMDPANFSTIWHQNVLQKYHMNTGRIKDDILKGPFEYP